jgi:tetratricopeptide (TPR) repeat protein
MQAAAITSRFLTGCSSKVGLADSEIVVSNGALLHQIVVSHLAQTVYSQEIFLKLTNALIRFAEQAFTQRDLNVLEEASRILMNLPVDAARQIGIYYHALAINRRGQRDEAEGLLETVADNAPITYRARAIQTLGAGQHYKGQLDEALRFQLEALRVVSDKTAQGLQTTLLAHLEISHVKSDTGDHKGALAILDSVSPLVEIVSRQNPLYFYFYHNELAVEFGELGRITEAQRASEVALASPYAPAYPNWAETRKELEAKRMSATPSIVAINRVPEAEPSPQRQPEPWRTLSFSRPASNKDSFQRSVIPITSTGTIAFNAISVLDLVSICISPRAPPPFC